MKRVLILGAGLVSRPIIRYLLDNLIKVKVASQVRDRADDIIDGNALGTSVEWSMDNTDLLNEMVTDNDIVVSLLPAKFHPEVARVCLKCRKPLITTSYLHPEIQKMDREAREAGIIFLSEAGLDPGLDHMSAMKLIDNIHGKGGQVEQLFSFCGALPAPEAADNPLKYKFSWSPRGVLLASKSSALYLMGGKEIFIEQQNLFKDRFSFSFRGVGELEIYPNRDSVSYRDIYNIQEVSTLYRGTIRYPGWCEALDFMKKINLLNENSADFSGLSYADFIAGMTGLKTENLRYDLAELFGLNYDSVPLRSLDFLGFFSDEKIPDPDNTAFGILATRMIEKMSMGDNERDMIVLQHIILAAYPGSGREVIKSSIVDFGSVSTDTAVARTVALPAAVATRLILEKKIGLTGVYRPVVPQIYNPVLEELRSLGIEMNEEPGIPETEILNLGRAGL